jgi:hypothetical protein
MYDLNIYLFNINEYHIVLYEKSFKLLFISIIVVNNLLLNN